MFVWISEGRGRKYSIDKHKRVDLKLPVARVSDFEILCTCTIYSRMGSQNRARVYLQFIIRLPPPYMYL